MMAPGLPGLRRTSDVSEDSRFIFELLRGQGNYLDDPRRHCEVETKNGEKIEIESISQLAEDIVFKRIDIEKIYFSCKHPETGLTEIASYTKEGRMFYQLKPPMENEMPYFSGDLRDARQKAIALGFKDVEKLPPLKK